MFESNPKSLESIVNAGYRFKMGEYISRGWTIYKQSPVFLIGFLILTIVINLVLQRIDSRIGVPASLVVLPPLSAGWFVAIFKLIKRETIQFSDFFKGFKYFTPLVISSILIFVFVTIGMILLIIPGIYLAFAYFFVTPLILDRKIDFWQAMEASRKIVTKKWFSFFGFGLVLGLINLGGAILSGLGLLVTIPLSVCSVAAAYDDIVGVQSTNF